MKKKLVWFLIAAMLFTMTACGDKKQEDKKNQQSKGTYEDGRYTNEDGSITLCDYKNLTGEKIIYEVREEELQEEIAYYLSDYAEYNDIKRPTKVGDYVTITLTASMNGEVLEEWVEDDGYEIQIGAGDYGAKFDKKLVGAKVGEELSFKIKYSAEDNPYEAGKGTIAYTVRIISAYEEILPELTDEFLEQTFGFESEEAMREYLKASLADTYEYNSTYQLREALLEQVIAQSTVHDYSDKLYKEAKATVENSWLSEFEWFGFTTMQEIYDGFGMTEADLEEEVIKTMSRSLVVQAICDIEGLELTDEEYETALEQYVIDWDYESEEALFEDYDEDTMYTYILEDKVTDFLIANATITERIALDSEYE